MFDRLTVTEETAVDLKQFLGTRLDELPLVQELKEIQKVLVSIAASVGKLKVADQSNTVN